MHQLTDQMFNHIIQRNLFLTTFYDVVEILSAWKFQSSKELLKTNSQESCRYLQHLNCIERKYKKKCRDIFQQFYNIEIYRYSYSNLLNNFV